MHTQVWRADGESHSLVLPFQCFVSLSVKLWSKSLAIIVEIEILNICFYLHPKSTLDKRKENYKYF